jgi:putative endonuclease
MFIYNKHLYFVYIVTNTKSKVLYIGVTNNLDARLGEHYFNRGNPKTFAGKYYCYNLIYYEEFQYINDAIRREKELKGWRRDKKENLIKTKNPDWLFLNHDFCIHWPRKKTHYVFN